MQKELKPYIVVGLLPGGDYVACHLLAKTPEQAERVFFVWLHDGADSKEDMETYGKIPPERWYYDTLYWGNINTIIELSEGSKVTKLWSDIFELNDPEPFTFEL